MADTKETFDKYIIKDSIELEIDPVEFRWPDSQSNFPGIVADEIQPLTTFNLNNSGTSHPSYGAVPNVTIGGIDMSTVGIDTISIGSSPVWTTTTTNNTGGYTFANTQPIGSIGKSGTVHIQGENADLVIGDKSMKTWMEKVEERLNILTPNPDMEKEWDDLRRLGERYRKLEKKCKEKAEVWNKLKSMPKPTTKW